MLLIILIPIGVLVVGKKKQSSADVVVVGLGKGAKGGDISDIDPSSVPVGFRRCIEYKLPRLIEIRVSIKERISTHSLGLIRRTLT